MLTDPAYIKSVLYRRVTITNYNKYLKSFTAEQNVKYILFCFKEKLKPFFLNQSCFVFCKNIAYFFHKVQMKYCNQGNKFKKKTTPITRCIDFCEKIITFHQRVFVFLKKNVCIIVLYMYLSKSYSFISHELLTCSTKRILTSVLAYPYILSK